MPNKLISLSYSPWSEKARFALDYAGVDYQEIHHLPMLGEPKLRLLAKKPLGRVSVPLLITIGGQRIGDSFAIAKFADERRQPGRASLFEGNEELAGRFNALSERMLTAGRRLVTARLATDPEALDAEVPGFIVGPLRQVSAKMGVAFFRKKWELAERDSSEEPVEILREGLATLRTALANRRTLGNEFSYADIAMACALQPVLPVSDRFISLPAARRRTWTQPSLVEDYGDLIAWRDAVYDERR